MITDYDLPPDWHDLSDAEKSRWMTQERCRRQAMRQRTGYAKQMQDEHGRLNRRQEASPAFVKVEEYR